MNGDRKVSIGRDRTAVVTIFSTFSISMFLMMICFFLSGCAGSKQSNFYMLFPLTQFSPTMLNADNMEVSLGIEPVVIPEYLNRPQIVTRSSPYEIDVSEFNRWGESLEESISRVLSENLSSLLSTDRIYTFPWGQKSLDYQVRIEIIQFDASIPGNIELMTRWTLIKDGDETLVDHRKYDNKKPIAGQGYSGMAAAMSLVLYDMSREIAETVIHESLGDEGTPKTD